MLTIGKVAQVTLALALPTSVILIYWWYKNKSDEETYGKRVVTSRNTIIEVKVPQRAIGAVIGRHGANIKQIQKDTGAWMHFQNGQAGSGDNASNTSRILVIQGTPESAHQAELIVHQVIAEMPTIITEEIEVPRYAIGLIIGKGGVTIREMSSISGAKINIERNDGYQNPETPRTVTISGSRQQIDCALELIQGRLEEEEKFRPQLSAAAAKKSQNSKDQTQKRETAKEQMKIVPVARKEESWDLTNSGCVSNQESLNNDVFVEVYVSAVEHPGHFWVQVIGTKALQLEQLQTDMTNFACSDDAKLNFAVKEIVPGELVMSKYEENDETYYRARLVGETPDGKVDLYFVDFGDSVYADKESMFKLRPDFVSFPFQAIECTLANVEPVGGKWSEESISCFEELTSCAKWKSVLARVVTYKGLNGDIKLPVVQLFKRTEPENLDIGLELVNKGYATLSNSAKQRD